jgi:hypothetical protein
VAAMTRLIWPNKPIAFPGLVGYGFGHEHDPECSMVVARREIGGQRSLML